MFERSLAFLREKLGDFEPDVCVILGSGLGDFVKSMQIDIQINYADIPDFPRTFVAGHKGYICCGKIGKHNVMCMQGRIHLYEGYPPQQIANIISIIAQLGVKTLIVTNAAGSLTTDLPAGSLMLISDHINFSGQNPLIGISQQPVFPDMSNAYDANLRSKVKAIAQKMQIPLKEGVYAMTLGPNYETAAEVKYFRICGADAIGMSTVPEVIAGVHYHMKVIGFSVISNLGCGLSNEKINHEDLLQVVMIACADLVILIRELLNEI